MFRRKNKRTTLQKQWSKRIMVLVGAIFLGFIIFLFMIFDFFVQSIFMSSLSLTGGTMGSELDQSTIHTIIQNKEQDNPQYLSIVRKMKHLQSESEQVISNSFMIVPNKDNQWVYMAGISEEEKIGIGEIYANNLEIIHKTVAEGKIQTSGIKKNLFNGEAYMTAYTPIKEGNTVIAVLGVDVRLNPLIRIELIVIGIIFAIMLLSLLIIRVIVKVMTKKQTRSIEILVDKMKEMASLEGDLTKRIQIEDKNEIGDLAMYTNQMLDAIQGVLVKVNDTSQKLLNTSQLFTQAFEKTVEEYKRMDTTVLGISERIRYQAEGTTTISSKMQGIDHAVNHVAEHAQNVTGESVNAKRNAERGSKSIEDMKIQMNEVVQVVQDTTGYVNDLGELSNKITGIVDTITSIADQTNLLALNASIEAARAGEQGNSFAVVANEVRNLAEESAASAEQISHLIKEVQRKIMTVETSMEEVETKTGNESKIFDQLTGRFDSIVKSIYLVSTMVEEVSGAAQEIAADSMMITQEVENLAQISEENEVSTEEIAAGIVGQTDSIQNMLKDVLSLEEMARELNQGLNKLKME